MKIAWEDMTPRQRRRRKKALVRQGVLALAVLVVAGGLGLGIWALVRQPVGEEPPADDALQAQLPVISPIRTALQSKSTTGSPMVAPTIL